MSTRTVRPRSTRTQGAHGRPGPMAAALIAGIAAALALSGCTSDESTHQRTTAAPTHSAESAPTAARATRFVIPDRAHDVELTLNEGDDKPKQSADPRVDIRRIVITFRQSSVQITERIADLRPAGYQQIIVLLHAPGVTWTGYAVINNGPDVSLHWELRGRKAGTSRGRCPEASARPDYAGDVFTLSVSTNCLANPPWVRASVSNSLLETNDAEYEDGMDESQMALGGYSAPVKHP